jgi:hypothetical protein
MFPYFFWGGVVLGFPHSLSTVNGSLLDSRVCTAPSFCCFLLSISGKWLLRISFLVSLLDSVLEIFGI